MCKTSHGCQVSYGECRVVKSPVKERFSNSFGSYPFAQCYSADGYCGKSSSHCKIECHKNYGYYY